jgi:hypothetical protein
VPDHHFYIIGAFVIAAIISAFVTGVMFQRKVSSYEPRPKLHKPNTNDLVVLKHARDVLNRWGARYSGTVHARRHVKETDAVIAEIDEILLRK